MSDLSLAALSDRRPALVPPATALPLDPDTPEQWLPVLNKTLDDRQQPLKMLDDYYTGNHPLAFASQKFRQAFGGLFREFADNWCELIVQAVEERLYVEGFRLAADALGDEAAWSIWQENCLDAGSEIAHTEALINGVSYALVWPGASDVPDITIEHPRQMVVAYAAGNPRQRTAAFKRWLDDTGYEFGTLYLPDGIYKFRSREKQKGTGSTTNRVWEIREVPDEPWPLHNPIGQVPVVALMNNPRLLTGGVSELVQAIPIQNAVNKLLADMIVASEFSAFRQRWVTGLDIETDEQTGQMREPFKIAVDRLLQAEDKDARFGEFTETNLENYVKAIELCVQHLASRTRTPPHYFYLSGQFPSGEAIQSSEAGLVAKTRRKMRHLGEAWEQVLRLAFAFTGDKAKAMNMGMETIWRDPEYHSESVHIDATVKLMALGVPKRILWERAGLTQTEIGRIPELQAEDRADETEAVAAGEAPAQIAETINVRA